MPLKVTKTSATLASSKFKVPHIYGLYIRLYNLSSCSETSFRTAKLLCSILFMFLLIPFVMIRPSLAVFSFADHTLNHLYASRKMPGRCSFDTFTTEIYCLNYNLKLRIPKGESVIIVQANRKYLHFTLNLICSAQRNNILTWAGIGIKRSRFLVW